MNSRRLMLTMELLLRGDEEIGRCRPAPVHSTLHDNTSWATRETIALRDFARPMGRLQHQQGAADHSMGT
jgi:hypothetical protein